MLASVILFPSPVKMCARSQGRPPSNTTTLLRRPIRALRGPGERAVSWALHLLVMLFVRIENFTPPEIEA
jgi:hypothetical protein